MTAGDTARLRYQFDVSLGLRVQMPDFPRSRPEGNLPTGSPPPRLELSPVIKFNLLVCLLFIYPIQRPLSATGGKHNKEERGGKKKKEERGSFEKIPTGSNQQLWN